MMKDEPSRLQDSHGGRGSFLGPWAIILNGVLYSSKNPWLCWPGSTIHYCAWVLFGDSIILSLISMGSLRASIADRLHSMSRRL
ncbi:hypothetical protein F5Y15DRAFT_358105 [Xylariaceae sp. FL0016]|nr:hypothetical protein F5Y15DRAFT_358105 [Xylariaceae sp. FL0016]